MKSNHSPNQKHLFLVEDDPELSNALYVLLSEQNFICHKCFNKNELFIKIKENVFDNKNSLAVLILDIRLKNENGMDIFKEINTIAEYLRFPVIFLTGHGDINLATVALKNGAFDFITKPASGDTLLETINLAFVEATNRQTAILFFEDWKEKRGMLTQKELEVMEMLCLGKSNKEISIKLGNSVRTIELHRARVFDKLQINSAVELAANNEKFNNMKLRFNVQ